MSTKTMESLKRGAAGGFLALALSCGSGSGGNFVKGYLFGSAVVNVGYLTSSGSAGRTDDEGTYLYRTGDTVVFSIGDLDFPEVAADRYITAADMSSRNDVDTTSINIERLLLSLDEDRIFEEKIIIPDTVHTYYSSGVDVNIDFSVSRFQFESFVESRMLLQYPGSENIELVSEPFAEARLVSAISDVANIYNDITSTEMFLESEPAAVKLIGSEISATFTDEFFTDLTREFWWNFTNDGVVTQSFTFDNSIVAGKSPWTVVNDFLCTDIAGQFGCRSVYQSGSLFRFGRVGDEKNLEAVSLKSVASDFEFGFPPVFIE